MANLIKKRTLVNSDKQILIAEDSYKVTLGAVIGDTGATSVDGKKIIKAGTPVSGDLKNRTTAFVKNTEAPNAIVLHDVDVTNGANNGTIVVAGAIDLNRLDTTVAGEISSAVEEKLPRIIFFK